jgi:hypothetical protein
MEQEGTETAGGNLTGGNRANREKENPNQIFYGSVRERRSRQAVKMENGRRFQLFQSAGFATIEVMPVI